MATRHPKALGSAGLLGTAVLFLAINLVSGLVFTSMRIDLTEDSIYTLTPGTRNTLDHIGEPVALQLYYSDKVSAELPRLRTYARRVEELLHEYVSLSKGKLTLEVIDPLPYSEEEDQATALGLQGVPVGESGEKLYFGLAASSAGGEVQTIGFFQPQRERFLEYDITRTLYTLANPDRPVIGVHSSLPVLGGFDVHSARMTTEWAIISQLRQLFELVELDLSSERIPEDIDILMLIHPKDLGEAALYSIDQFVMRGGRAIIFVDPHSEMDSPMPPSGVPEQPGGMRSSDLHELFDAWGIVYDPGKVVLDRRHALAVFDANQVQARHYALLGIRDEGLDREDVTSSDLELVSLGIAGHIRVREDSGLQLTPLVRSSRDAALTDAARFQHLFDATELGLDFESENTAYTLVARIRGMLKSAYPTGPANEEADDSPGDPGQAPHLASSEGEVNLVVVADTDTLSDSMWVQVQDFFGQRIFNAWSDNSALYANLLEHLTGSSDLMSIRSREVTLRPFVKVEALRRGADLKFRATEQGLQDKLEQTEAKLLELQEQRDDANALVLSPEQEAELKSFKQESINIRKELRQVRHNLDRDIERLGATLKFLNIGLVPLIISVLALALYVLRTRQRRAPTGR